MLGSLFRMAMLAGTGAGIVAGMRRAMIRIACVFLVAMVLALLVAGGIGGFGFALYWALVPEFGPVWAAAAGGALLIVLAGVIALVCRYLTARRPHAAAPGPDLGSLGAAALSASMGGASMGHGPDIRGALERNALTVLLAAFIAGMVMNNRR
jgi:hypothetical protein